MALVWDLSKVKDLEKNFPPNPSCEFTHGMNGITFTILMLTVTIGVGTLTTRNCQRFIDRVMEYQLLAGPLLRKGEQPAWLKPEHIRAHIGMVTNTREETAASWNKIRKHLLKVAVHQALHASA